MNEQPRENGASPLKITGLNRKFTRALPVVLTVVVFATAIRISCHRLDRAERLERVMEEVRAGYPDVKPISTDALEAWLSDASRAAPLLLDVRGPDEFHVSHLREAVASDGRVSETAARLGEDRPLIVYCSVGVRSAEAARELNAAGCAEVYNLEGGIFRWVNEGNPVFCGNEEVDRVHPYDRYWGRLLDPALRLP